MSSKLPINLHIRMDLETQAKLHRLAQHNHMPVTQYVRWWINTEADRLQAQLDADKPKPARAPGRPKEQTQVELNAEYEAQFGPSPRQRLYFNAKGEVLTEPPQTQPPAPVAPQPKTPEYTWQPPPPDADPDDFDVEQFLDEAFGPAVTDDDPDPHGGIH